LKKVGNWKKLITNASSGLQFHICVKGCMSQTALATFLPLKRSVVEARLWESFKGFILTKANKQKNCAS